MKHLILRLFVLLLLPTSALYAQTDSTDVTAVGEEKPAKPAGWDLSADLSLFQTQSTYSENWDGEEQGTMAWHATANSTASRKLTTRMSNRTVLKLEYGQTQTQDRVKANWTVPTKSFDLIECESVFTFDFNRGLGPFLSGRFESQFTDLRNSREIALNPMQFTESGGFSKTFLQNDVQHIGARLGAAVRQKSDRNNPVSDTTGVWEESYVIDAGLQFVSEISTPLLGDRVKLDARLSLFQALSNSEAARLGNEWKSVDVDLLADFNTRVTEWIQVYMRIRFKYDQEISKAGRLKELLELGLTYSLL